MVQELDTLMYKIPSYAKRCMEDGAYASIGEMGVPRIRGDDPGRKELPEYVLAGIREAVRKVHWDV